MSSGFFVFRTPLLPFDELRRFSAGLRATSAAPDELDGALDADRRVLRQRLADVVARPEVIEALFLASPTLVDSLQFWRSDPDSERGQKVERSLVRYFARMAGRATPYGLFAGHAVGRIAGATSLELAPLREYRRHTRLDMDYVWALSNALADDAELRQRLRYFPNSSLYLSKDGRLHYAEARVYAEHGRSYHLVAAELSPYLLATLEQARRGASLPELLQGLCAMDATLGAAEVAAFLQQLVNSQLLIPELEPAVTGAEPIPQLIAELRRHPPAARAAACLADAQTALESLDRAGPGADIERYKDIARRLGELPVPVDIARLYQVDLVKPAPASTLGSAVVKELLRAAELLHSIGTRVADPLRDFREAFVRRYEAQEVPLLEALDPENGIALGEVGDAVHDASPLLEGLGVSPLPAPGLRADSARDMYLLRRVQEALAAGSTELVLDDRDRKALHQQGPPLPNALHVVATLSAASGAACARGEFELLLEGVGGPSGATLLGRFCHADAELSRGVLSHLRAEEALRPDAIFAELVHLPQGRIGNVLSRPLLREYEILYLGRSGAPLERQLPAGDLLVSVVEGRVRLRSARLGREVIPCLSNAHNYLNPGNVALYRFLGCVAHEGVISATGWRWGLLEHLPFLPRVRHGRIVLSPARWSIVGGLDELGQGRASERFARVQAFRARHGLPRCVLVADVDNRLPVDFDNALSVESFVHLVKRRPTVLLTEQLPSPEKDQLCARGPEGAFVHQLVVPFVRKSVEPPSELRPHASKTEVEEVTVPRRFAPGSEWLYVKIYTGAAGVDQVLDEVIAPLCAAVVPQPVQRWFFIRYGDPDWHLRVRFCGEAGRLHGEVLPQLHARLLPFLARGYVHRVTVDTYEREVERYGGPSGILLAERLFHADSEAALVIVRALPGDKGKSARWRMALRGLHDLFTDLGIELAERRDLLRTYRDNLARAHLSSAPALGEKFRRLRTELLRIIDGPPPPWHRSALIAEVAADLRAQGLLRPDIIGSYLHMHVNRLLRASAVAHELVLYDFLLRLYESKLAQSR